MKTASGIITASPQQQHHRTTVSSVASPEHQVKAQLTATDVSFSSYLKPNESGKKTSLSPRENASSVAADDSELSIFDAKKYFNEGSQQDQVLGSSKRVSPLKEFNNTSVCDPSSFPRFSSASSVDGYGHGYRTRSLASSEASYNSQTGLLSSNGGAANSGAQRGEKKGCRMIPRWMLYRPKCPCSGKKSVQVKESAANNHGVSTPKEAQKPITAEVRAVKVNVVPDYHERFITSVRQFRPSAGNNLPTENGGRHLVVSATPKPLIDGNISSSAGFTFPVLPPPSMSPSSPPPPLKMPWNGSQSSPSSPHPNPIHPLPGNPPRSSLDVFKPPSDYLDSRKSQENHNHHPILRFPISVRSQQSTTADELDELGSDASSDLFEIESISTQATYPITHNRQRDSLDEARPRLSSSRNFQADEKQGKSSGEEQAKEYSVNSPEFERSPKV